VSGVGKSLAHSYHLLINPPLPRHLAEYTHVEAELGFIAFDDLLTHIESMICDSVQTVLADPVAGPLVRELNPEFVAPARPFLRMDYKKAIAWLNEHEILFQDDDTAQPPRPHKIGDDIAEAAERKTTDILNVPMFITGFPREMKAFYMKRFENDPEFTESCDLLMPGVGEIVGGSMRMTDLSQLLQGYKDHGIDPTPYYWYNDQRTYGTMEHGG
jgi:asparaginyl-tRNA synthetase